MAYNELLADTLRNLLVPYGDEIQEKKMFGGISFLYHGKMCVGIVKNELAVRVIASKIDFVLEKSNVRIMDFTKSPMKEFIFVNPTPTEDLNYWINIGVEHAKSKI